ncbi:type VI secretion system baseplate subunit TssF [Marinomonas mediterranea]|uniref:type VI secretion system baseplate subunit TssF n=1 Tax=Marinomonas mediterranea TaxID=119864 RepID=UPI0023491F7E|nr:type VI secretion system baseplate subunit TssF [Marinomonas mediterranea]WCN08125.1 type VI secretion system baseplate subunit TssF [Marinomonas mediterranea]WCN12195.1 type VI secretion system baseplate subunit TssF [Marinomonas mediterranea]
MSDQLLSYFERELAYVRRALDSFGSEFPDHAASMRLNQTGQEDPNISRLIDAMALLTAKTEKRIDEQLPDVLQDLFSVLYPGYLQIIPSYTPLMVELGDDPITERVVLPKGSQASLMVKEAECLFSLVEDLIIEPFIIKDIQAESAPFNFPTPKTVRRAESVVQITLNCSDPSVFFSQLDFTSSSLGKDKNDHFDFYVRGFENSSRGLIDLLLLNTEAISLFDEQGNQVEIDTKRLVSRAADPSFNWLPNHGNHQIGFDLVREYFAYPDKAAYIRLEGLYKELSRFQSSTVTLNFFVQQLPVEYLRLFNRQVFLLNTTPAINLYPQRGEPMRYDFTKLSIPVVADTQANNELTVVSVEKVCEVLPTGEVELSPIYEGGYWFDDSAPKWQVRQFWDEKGRRLMDLSVSYGSEVTAQDAVVLSMSLKVCNGRLPCLVPSYSHAESYAAVDIPGELKNVRTPTAPQYPALDNQLSWRFVAMLNANFSSLTQADDATRALQDVLRLSTHSIQCKVADSIKNVSYKHLVAPITIDRQSIFASGTQVTILIDDELLGADFAVVSNVLNGFYQQYCSFDRFMQVNVERFGSDVPGIEFEKCHGSQLCL